MAVRVEHALRSDQAALVQLIAAYHVSEGCSARPERVRWAVEQLLQERIEGVILVARENETVVGVLLGVSMPSTELGRVLVVQDFFVEPHFRRRGVGRALACRILQEARDMGIDEVDVEILPTNSVAMAFWKSMSFETTGRTVHRRSLT